MAVRPFFNSVRIGLDVQPDAVRVLQLLRSRRGMSFVCAGSVNIQGNVFNEDIVINWDALQSAVTELLLTFELQKVKAIICLPASLASMRSLTVPLQYNQRQVISAITEQIDPDNSVGHWQIDYWPGASQASGSQAMSFVATPRAYLLQYLNCMRAAGCHVSAIDIDAYALMRCLAYGLQQKQLAMAGWQAVLQVASSYVRLVVCEQQTICLHKKWGRAWIRQSGREVLQLVVDEITFSGFPVDSLIITGDEKLVADVGLLAWPYSVFVLAPLASLANRSEVEFPADISSYLLAAGLAMHGAVA